MASIFYDMKWETTKQPTQRDWYLCKVNGQKLPLLYNDKNNFWTGVDGKVYNNVEWLDDEPKIISDALYNVLDEVICHLEDIALNYKDIEWEDEYNETIKFKTELEQRV